MVLGWLLGNSHPKGELGQICWSESCGWYVEHKGSWFSVNDCGEITCSQRPPASKVVRLGAEWLAAQALLEYSQIITDMDRSCLNQDAMWPTALVYTAERIDLLSKTLAISMGKEHQVGRE